MTALGYRSYFTIGEGRDRVVRQSLDQLNAWLTGQDLDPDGLTSGRQVELGEGVTGVLIRPPRWDGSTTVRARVVETRATGAWTTELTVHVPRLEEWPASVLVDVHAPDDGAARSAEAPGLVSLLLGVLDARDASAVLLDRPVRVVGVAQAERLAEVVCDADRRGLLFVAGSSKRLPDMHWYEYVRALVRRTHGLAASYYMDPTATRALEEILGPTHAVQPGALRAYRPEADPASELDALRHRVLSTEQILSTDLGMLGRTLVLAARDQALGSELPSIMEQLDTRLRQHCDASLLASLTRVAPVVPAAPVVPELALAPEPADGPDVGAMVRRVLGLTAEADDEALGEVERLALLGLQATASEAEVRRELEERQARIEQLATELRRTAKRLEDEQLEHYDTYEQVQRLEHQLAAGPVRTRRPVQAEMALAGPPVGIPASRAPEDDDAPRSFAELIDRIETLPGVEFTGDADIAIDLGDCDPLGLWAIKAWRIVCALSDYARESVAGRCPTGVDGYLRQLPAGCRGYSANKHAPTESITTQSIPRFRRARLFPVPRVVDRRGLAMMYAHFRIAQSGQLSPRLHYLDDTARTGKVYVGYIGPHLPNKQTN